MSEILGYRGWCRRCKHGKLKWKSVYCQNKESAFYKQKTNSVLCAPCFTEDPSKLEQKIGGVSFGD